MSIHRLLFASVRGHCKSTNKACWSSAKRTSSSSHRKLTCSRHDIADKAELALSKNHSLTFNDNNMRGKKGISQHSNSQR